MTQTEKYRWDGSTGTLYVYDSDQRAYLFAAKANGRTEKQTIRDYEEAEYHQDGRNWWE